MISLIILNLYGRGTKNSPAVYSSKIYAFYKRSIFEVLNFRGFRRSRPMHEKYALELIRECQEPSLQQWS